ncbi:MAG: lipoyl synthase [Spirochaetes bacterium GWF1_51_8]|nr:MAG: lipoyl synthase [Spirochaetes bacterium GWF1_51_8]
MKIRRMLSRNGLHTICEEALCPNISECSKKREASFLILGKVCTRGCTFCNVEKGVPLPADPAEPEKIALAVSELGLKHAVITSPTRDDLPDGGAEIFAQTISAIRKILPGTAIEVLVPDFRGDTHPLDTVCHAMPDLFGHNIETVPRLYGIRKGADFKRSLSIFSYISSNYPSIPLKSGLMLGLGETASEVVSVMRDLYAAGCRYLSLGQYLAPGKNFYPVREYIAPETFAEYKKDGMKTGFLHIESAPFVRSSYMASEYLKT